MHLGETREVILPGPHIRCHDYPTGVSTGAASVASTAKGKVYGHSPASGLDEGRPHTVAVHDYSVP